MKSLFLPPKWNVAPSKKIYWSRAPGNFVDKDSGEESHGLPVFSGPVLDWYTTIYSPLIEICENNKINLIISPESFALLSHTRFYFAKTDIKVSESDMRHFTINGCDFYGHLLLADLRINLFVNAFWPTNVVSATESCDKLDERHDLIIKR